MVQVVAQEEERERLINLSMERLAAEELNHNHSNNEDCPRVLVG